MITLLALTNTAFAYEAEPQDFTVESKIKLFDGQTWTSDVYGGSTLGVQITVEPNLTVTTYTSGTAEMSWPSDLNVEVNRKRSSGEMRVQGSYKVTTTVLVDAYFTEFEMPVNSFDVPFDDVVTYDPFAPAQVNLQGADGWSIDYEVGSVPITGSILMDFNTEIFNEAIQWNVDGEPVPDGGTTSYPVTDAGFKVIKPAIVSEVSGQADFDLDIVIGVEVVGIPISISPTILADDLFYTLKKDTSQGVNVRFGLPAIDAPATANGGAVELGETAEFVIDIENLGEGLLTGGATTNNPAFEVVNDTITADADGTDQLIIEFTPTEVGEVTGKVFLATNDPANPEIEIALTASGLEASGGGGNGGGGDDGNGWDGWPEDDKNNLAAEDPKGCGCASSNGAAPLWTVAGLIGLVGLRRRRS